VWIPTLALGLKGFGMIANNPVSGIIVPVWSVAAYIWISQVKIGTEAEIPSIR
jgi:hypothetical protein